jgi:arsenate reductase (thioredoxin)
MRRKSTLKIAALLWGLSLFPIMAANAGDGQTVVFVCEHGNAKSLIAATLFNSEAARRHLPLHAVARGVSPAQGVPQPVATGLHNDGYDVSGFEAKPITVGDLQAASRVVLLNLDRSSVQASNPQKTDVWAGIPPFSTSYPEARDAIARRIDLLLRQLVQHAH